jgi:hypothetical protein
MNVPLSSFIGAIVLGWRPLQAERQSALYERVLIQG